MWCSSTGYIGSTWREWVDNFIPFQEIDIAFFYTPFQEIVLHLNFNPSFFIFPRTQNSVPAFGFSDPPFHKGVYELP